MSNLPAGWRMLVHDQLPSTADLLRQKAEGGAPERLAILARRQTAGRGTRGRTWESPPGNLYLSVLLRPTAPVREVPQWGLLAAVALHAAVSPFAAGLSLKWPNDLLLGGAKCAGILSEAALRPDGRLDWLAFGIGVNLAFAPEVPGRRTATLPAPVLPPEEAAARLMGSLDHWREVMETRGFAAIREAWLERGPPIGTPISVTAPAGPLLGSFEGLDGTGALLISTAGGMETVTAGDVHP
ncbi:biotin--[acetyl-CoA-carboxylase] ligase [Roseomonas sp. KE2513]|uniref:biotin--[acetyl-CoA-carboxylase] ligase n=1 Tax=Roseomonas sp. KE2513 TaxID=2479202 RepID=UPI0028155BA8|nr:biotin--[acetyl-CoA-carboxylase] ligase [Roseomonas sp. KE2513]